MGNILLLVVALAWGSDIDYLASELPKQHPNPFFRVSRAEFQGRLDSIKAQSGGLSDFEVAVRLQQAVASLGDAHTELDIRFGPITYYPLRLYAFDDGLYVTKTTEASRGACGARLVAIDGVGAAEVYARAATVISRENEWWSLARTPNAMVRAELLTALGVTSDARARFTFESAGALFDLELEPIDAAEAARTIFAPDVTADSTPLYRRDAARNYWFSWRDGLLYIKYNRCREDPALPMSSFARTIFDIIDGENVDRLVIDLRDNSGGSSAVLQPLIDGIRTRAQLRGRTFAIIGRVTFSSGMLNAIDLRDRAGALLVGEPTGGNPNGYGEVKSFQLPSSHLVLYHSTKFFHLVPGDPGTVEPAIRASVAAADFFGGRDPVLDSVLEQRLQTAPSSASGRRRAVTHPPLLICPH